MEETYLLHHPGVKKKILHGGLGPMLHFPPGTKTMKDNFERTVIDDSRRGKGPMEIFVGKMFKMEVWEVLLTSMRVGEVAEFWCDAIHTGLYPIVSKGMRLIAQGKDPLEGQKHMCGMGNMFYYNCSGFPELDELMKEPQPLIFIMELLSVDDAFSYKRESWMMGKDEKLQVVPSLHLQGNTLVKQGRLRDAASKYQEAVVLLRTVQSREMPGDEVHVNLEQLIVPLVLNYCQCMLELQEYYEVLEHTTELLQKHKDNVKAYYKRAKAHAAVWNETEARQDFLTVARLDVTLAALVQRELRHLANRMREKHLEEKNSYWAILQEKGGQASLQVDGGKGEATAREEGAGGTLHGPGEEKTQESEAARKCGERQETRQGASVLMEGKDWQQMLRLVPLLQDEGNFLVKELRHLEAAEKYQEAIEYIRSLQDMLDVDRNKEDWDSLEKLHLPLSLNLSQCMLELGEYHQVLETNTKLLRKHRGNLKAMYQSARAHAALHQENEARKSFAHIVKLDPKFKPIACMLLKKMSESIRAKHVLEKRSYWAVAEERWGHGGPGKNGEATQQGKEAGAHREDRVQLVRTTKNGESKDGQETAKKGESKDGQESAKKGKSKDRQETAKKGESKDGQGNAKMTKSLPGPSVEMASENQRTVDHSVKMASEKQRTVDQSVEIASENQRSLDPSVQMESENQRSVDPSVEIASKNQRTVDQSVEIASENQRSVDPSVEIASKNQRTVDQSVEIASENQRSVDPSVQMESENQRSVDPSVEMVSKNQRTVDQSVEIASENQRSVDPSVQMESENQRSVDPSVEMASEFQRSVDPNVEIAPEN